MISDSPCQASRGHSTSFTVSLTAAVVSSYVPMPLRHFGLASPVGYRRANRQSGRGLRVEQTPYRKRARVVSLGLQDSGLQFRDFGVERGGFQGPNQGFAGLRGVDDGVDPEAGSRVAWIGLVFVGGTDRFDQFFFGLFVNFFTFAF